MTVFEKISAEKTFRYPSNWPVLKTIEMHTGGEPLRVITSGYPAAGNRSVLEYRNLLKSEFDHFRTALMFEPRGHADMYGCVLMPPQKNDSDFGVLFMHNEGYSTMCGHATIALAKLAVEMGWIELIEPITEFKIDAPCGQLRCFAHIKDGEVVTTSFLNVPSFVVSEGSIIDLPGFGKIKYDVAYGGAFYAFVDADDLGISMTTDNYRNLIEIGMDIKRAVSQTNKEIKHPYEPDLSFLYGTIFTGKGHSADAHSRNVCIFAEGEVDRSPTGSGVSARMAIHHKRGDLKVGDEMVIESILGTRFKCRIDSTLKYAGHNAVIPYVEGNAFVTGMSEFAIDPNDPLKEGFILR